LHGRSQKTKAPRSARGAQQHQDSFANIVNRPAYRASHAIGELSHSTPARCIRRREQERAQLASPARRRVDVICDVLPKGVFRHTVLSARHRAVELETALPLLANGVPFVSIGGNLRQVRFFE
jgi:hypothetical protein